MANGGQTQPFNVNTASANGLQSAMNTTAAAQGYQAPTLAGADMSAYQNPYQQQVINNTIGDMDRARQMTMNDVGANATSAGAFGGARHGLVEAETNRNFADQVGNYSAQMNQAGFQNAQNAAMYDIGNDMASQNMQLNAANQLGGLSNQAFNTGQQINSSMLQAGSMQQALNQDIINAGKDQYSGFTNSPTQALSLPLAALGVTPQVGSSTTSQQPGLFNYLSMGLGLL